MKVYLDSDFRCHTEAAAGLREVETGFFDGKCEAFVEGYRFVPSGESWTNGEGVVFHGEMVSPAEDSRALEKAQAQHERDEAAHLEELGALIEEIYNEDMEMIDDV